MRSKKLNHIFSGGMYGGKNTLIGRGVDRREACSPDVILSKNSFFDSQVWRLFAYSIVSFAQRESINCLAARGLRPPRPMAKASASLSSSSAGMVRPLWRARSWTISR